MFTSVNLHGGSATLLWHYHEAAVLSSWRIWKDKDGQWKLSGTMAHLDRFLCRQRPLLFTAPRDKGMWAWGIDSLEIGPNQWIAHLGPPEQ